MQHRLVETSTTGTESASQYAVLVMSFGYVVIQLRITRSVRHFQMDIPLRDSIIQSNLEEAWL